MLFPDELGNDELKNVSGSTLKINPVMLNERIMCVNGAFYGMNEIQDPSAFASVIGPVFQYKSARSFLYALVGSSLFSSYVSDLAKYIVLVPTAEQFEASGIRTVYSTQGQKLAVLPNRALFIYILPASQAISQVNYQKAGRG